jgi:hypothetical protein
VTSRRLPSSGSALSISSSHSARHWVRLTWKSGCASSCEVERMPCSAMPGDLRTRTDTVTDTFTCTDTDTQTDIQTDTHGHEYLPHTLLTLRTPHLVISKMSSGDSSRWSAERQHSPHMVQEK